MQMEQVDDQKTIRQYREEHSTNFRNELRSKFIQRSREKHFQRQNNNHMNNNSGSNNNHNLSQQITIQASSQQQQQQSIMADESFGVANTAYFKNGGSYQETMNPNGSSMLLNNFGQDFHKLNQDAIIEENHGNGQSNLPMYNSHFSCNNNNNISSNQNGNPSLMFDEFKVHNERNQSIQYMSFQGSVQALLSHNDVNVKVLILQHITDLIENNLQEIMDFSFILQNHSYLLDIIKEYIEFNFKTINSSSQFSNPIRNLNENGNKGFMQQQSLRDNVSSSSHTVSLHELESTDSSEENNNLMWAINLISLIAYTKQEDVSLLIKKGFVDLFMNIFMENNQNIKIAEKIISFFANVISVDEVMKTHILTNIPIKLFLFFFINNEYHTPSFLDFHQILSLFLNKCYLQSDLSSNSNNNNNGGGQDQHQQNPNSQDDSPILQSLNFIFNSVIVDFLAALRNFINDTQIAINLSEILTYICSNLLKTYPLEMLRQHLNEIKQLIQLQMKSGIKPLQIQSIKLMIKIFQSPHILQEFDDEAKNFMIQTLKDSLHCDIKQIRISSITAIISLLQGIHDDSQYTNIIQFLYHSIFERFDNDNQMIKLYCLEFFQSLINHCSTSQNVPIEWKLKMGDQILVSLIQQLKKCNLVNTNIDFVLKILNLLSQIVAILNSNPFKHKFQLNYLQDSGLLEVLSILQQQKISYDIQHQAYMILQLFYSVQSQK